MFLKEESNLYDPFFIFQLVSVNERPLQSALGNRDGAAKCYQTAAHLPFSSFCYLASMCV